MGHFVTLVIIGHSDHQDDTVTFPTVEARRASEQRARKVGEGVCFGSS
jgi:hypothetical protein